MIAYPSLRFPSSSDDVFLFNFFSLAYLSAIKINESPRSIITSYLFFCLFLREIRDYMSVMQAESCGNINKRKIKMNLFTFSLVFIWISPCYFELIFQILICGSVFSVYAYLYKMVNSRGGGRQININLKYLIEGPYRFY